METDKRKQTIKFYVAVTVLVLILIIIAILLFFIMCVLSAIKNELEKTRLENREIVNLLNKRK